MTKPILLLRAYLFYACVLMLFIPCCRKSMSDGRSRHQLLTEARSWFQGYISTTQQRGDAKNERTQSPRMVNWHDATLAKFHNQPAILVPIQTHGDPFIKTDIAGENIFRLDNQQRLMLYQDSAHRWQAELLTFLPDSNFLRSNHQEHFTGVILVEDWWGNPLRKYLHSANGAAGQLAPEDTHSGTVQALGQRQNPAPNSVITSCTYLYGYNYTPSNPDGGTHWVQLIACKNMVIPEKYEAGGNGYGGLGGSAGGGSSSGAAPTIRPPTSIITNLQDYLKCFQLTAGATYQVTVCVDQPKPGTRTPWTFTNDGSSGSINPVNVGHTFLLLEQINLNGFNISRYIGFYPSSNVTPFSNPVPGVLNDDGMHKYNIGARFNMNRSQFFALLGAIPGLGARNYQANTYNCTNFALDALDAAHAYLPRTIGYWIGGLGLDPGDLGEDIRNGNFTGMVRIMAPVPSANIGSCN